MKNEIYSYIRDNNGKRLGLFVAERCSDQSINIGFSKVNYEKGDKFDLTTGIHEARNKMPISQSDIPKILMGYYVSFLQRCCLYFKDAKINIGTVKAKDLVIK